MHDPFAWYWLADDGRLYSSAAQALVDDDDTAYVAWCEATGFVPTRWPEDAAGDQTDSALADVLAPYGLALWPVPLIDRLLAYAADKRWQVETGGIEVGGAAIDTSRDSQAMITGAYAWSQANPTETISYKAASGWVAINAATMAAIATAVGAHVQACFAAEADVAAEIEDGSITTTEQIDAADWPG